MKTTIEIYMHHNGEKPTTPTGTVTTDFEMEDASGCAEAFIESCVDSVMGNGVFAPANITSGEIDGNESADMFGTCGERHGFGPVDFSVVMTKEQPQVVDECAVWAFVEAMEPVEPEQHPQTITLWGIGMLDKD